jgi:GT2 family glycosyltransferase
MTDGDVREPSTTHAGAAPRVSAIVLAYGEEPWLEPCVDALLGSTDVDVEVVLVDNGCTDGAVDRLRGRPSVVHAGDGTNLGFAAGNNVGVAASSGEFVALINGDLVVSQDALVHLVKAVADSSVGIAGASVRLSEDPERLNSDGNIIHFLGFSWCGDFGARAVEHADATDITSAMGAAILLRRSVWDELDGFEEAYFAFHEDADLCWRARQRGYRVRYVPEAIGFHRYEFSRRNHKMYLAERNRLMFVLTCWDRTTLVLIAPALLAVEAAVLLTAVRQGWFGQKIAGWRWLWSRRSWLRARRHDVQRARTVSDRALAPLLADRLLGAGNFELPAALEPLDRLLAAYWALVRRRLR